MSEFQDKVNNLVNQMVQTDEGKWQLPAELSEGLDEATQFAITAERRYRDTQSAYTRASQEAKKNKAIAEGLQDRLLNSEVKLTTAQRHELNELKQTNPEKWREKLNEYEIAGKQTLKQELDEIAITSANKSEREIREEQMAAWSASTGIELTDEIVDNDLPPRYKKDLEAGRITFQEFLTRAGDYLKADKVVQGASEDVKDDTKNLSDVAGGKEPSKQAQDADFDQSYENTIFWLVPLHKIIIIDNFVL